MSTIATKHQSAFRHQFKAQDLVRMKSDNTAYRVASVEYADYGDKQVVLYHLIDINADPQSLDIKQASVAVFDLQPL